MKMPGCMTMYKQKDNSFNSTKICIYTHEEPKTSVLQ